MNYTSLVSLLLLYVVAANAIQWQDCGSKLSKVKNVIVSGCETAKICPLPKGQNVTFTVDFITSASAKDAKSVVHGIIERIPVPFPIPHPDACTDKQSGIACPLKASKTYDFHPYIYVSPSYPKVKAIVKWELQNQSGEDIFCVVVPVEIVDAPKKFEDNHTKTKYSNRTPKLYQLLRK